jgi:hypothetical protein
MRGGSVAGGWRNLLDVNATSLALWNGRLYFTATDV